MTFYEKVHSLEAAHTLTVKPDGSYEKKRYWQLNAEINSNLTLSQAKTRFRELFYTAVKRRLRSDVTVGSSLSGGLDSSAVVLAMNELLENSSSQNTFSARFHDPALDEGNYMQAVVEGKNITPHYVYPNAETLIDEIDLLFYHQEQPFGSASIFAQWEVMRLAQQQNVTVLLDGQGADEILAGYPRYFRSYFKGLLRQNPKAFMEEVKAYEQLYKHTWKSGPSFYMECYLPQLLLLAGKLKRSMGSSANYQQLDSDFFHTFKNEPSPFTYYRNLNDDLHHSTTVYGLEKLLRFSDRNAMAFSREVRLPFLFHDLVEFVFSQPDQMKLNKGWTKYLLREAMENELPSSIKNRVNKIGFEPPQGDWMKQKQMSERIVAARKQLISQNYIEPGARITDWQALMVDLLLQQKY
jgi:asparagine synthase (glutamine-hydrolysing)